MLLLASTLAGCGSVKHSDIAPFADSGQTQGATSSHIVTTAQARSGLEHAGYEIKWKQGPIPAGFAGALYGSARAHDGTTIDFAFLLTGSRDAEQISFERFERLVPNATRIGSTAGQSYIEVTNAGAHKSEFSKGTDREATIADILRLKVAKLAPGAFSEEGP